MNNNNKQNTENYNFGDTIKNFINPESFWKGFNNIPNFGSYTNNMKKNTETVTNMHKLLTQNLYEMTKNNSDVAHKYITDTYDSLKNILSTQNPEEASTLQQNYVKNSIENAINATKNIVDITTKTITDLGQLYSENMQCCANQKPSEE